MYLKYREKKKSMIEMNRIVLIVQDKLLSLLSLHN